MQFYIALQDMNKKKKYEDVMMKALTQHEGWSTSSRAKKHSYSIFCWESSATPKKLRHFKKAFMGIIS